MGLRINAFSTQTNNLQEWADSGGSVIATVNSDGNIYNNGYLLFGRESFLVVETTGTTTTSTTFVYKTSGTTPNISNGYYMLQSSFRTSAGAANSGRSCEVRISVDGSIVATAGIPLISAIQAIPCVTYSDLNLTAGIHTILLEYRTTNSGTAAQVGSIRIWLYRIN